MKNPNLAKRTADSLRTAPVAFALYTMGVVYPASEIMAKGSGALSDWTLYALEGIGMHAAGVERRMLFDIRDRLVDSMERHGFDERPLRIATSFRCGRQAAKIACEQTGYRKEFDEFIAKSKEQDYLEPA